MPWLRLELLCSHKDSHLIEEILFNNGANSIELTDARNNPIYEPTPGKMEIWQDLKLIATFPDNISKKFLKKILSQTYYSQLKFSYFDNSNWVNDFQQNFQAKKFGENLWVVPSWYTKSLPSGSLRVKLDPGMSFGTGNHETTAMCLEYLEKNRPLSKVVIDYGCGSGILAIASAMLGAKKVYAIDYDPIAIKSSMENAKKNSVENLIEISTEENLIIEDANLIIANIFLTSLIELKPIFDKFMHKDTRLVLSGILINQIDRIFNSYNEGFNHKVVSTKNDWCLIELIKS